MEKPKIIIVTGLSGSGKSTALAALEDAGFYCVDNMPVLLLPDFLRIAECPRIRRGRLCLWNGFA